MKQSSNWPLVILDHKKMKSLKWRFLKLLLHLFSLTYLMLNQQQTPTTTPARGSATHESGSTVPTQSATSDSTLAHGQDLQPIFE